jgi:hypothetical protein
LDDILPQRLFEFLACGKTGRAARAAAGPSRRSSAFTCCATSASPRPDSPVDFGSLAQEDIMRSLRIFADQVLPHVRDI